MKNTNRNEQQTTRGSLLIACVATLGVAFTVALSHAAHIDAQPQAAHPGNVPVLAVPANLQVPPPNEVVLVGHAIGTQNYICLPSDAGVAWTLFTPQATLFRKHGQQLTTHFFSPNPFENGIVRAAWQHSRDSSTVWGRATQSSSDPSFVAPGAIPWLLVERAGVQEGPAGGDQMTETTFIQRLNTLGGVAPATGCGTPTDIGSRAFVPYRADYFFYEDPSHHGRNK